MYPFYAYGLPPAHSSHHQPQFVSAGPYPPAAPHALAVPHEKSLLTFDEMIKKRYTDSDGKLRDAISSTWFPSPETRQQCLNLVSRLRIYRHLFMHIYVHLVSCYQGRYLHLLVDNANIWKGWNSVQQLVHHSLIKDELLEFCKKYPCHQHSFVPHPVTSEDDSDLLCHLLYCGRKPELYDPLDKPAVRGPWKESEQIIELLWQYLMKSQDIEVTRRLRAFIYRIARKSAYLPLELRIPHPHLSNKRDLGAGAHALVTKATMNGRQDVVIKRILCNDRDTQRKCFKLFASEAILWKTLQHKNIVPFLGVVIESTVGLGLVSPFFKNGNIKDYMKRYDPKYWSALARGWARDLAEGLEYIHCHEPPIVHGDLKGDNVLVDDAGHARLGDFGQSYASDSGKYLDSTRVGLAAYSPVHWMAPEIMKGGERAQVTDKSDIYSFGCVLYEMVSGEIPFEGLSFGDVVKRVTSGKRPKRPKSISGGDPLWKITESCWQSHHKNRPSATRLVSSLS